MKEVELFLAYQLRMLTNAMATGSASLKRTSSKRLLSNQSSLESEIIHSKDGPINERVKNVHWFDAGIIDSRITCRWMLRRNPASRNQLLQNAFESRNFSKSFHIINGRYLNVEYRSNDRLDT